MPDEASKPLFDKGGKSSDEPERPTCTYRCDCETPSLEPLFSRRDFLATAGATTAGLVTGMTAAGRSQAEALDVDHFVPEDKQLTQAWLDALKAPGERKAYRGKELATIGMPCGGVAAGQLYVLGDGSLGYWWLANDAYNTGNGAQTSISTPLGNYDVCYTAIEPPTPIDQGFAIRTTTAVPRGNESVTTQLSKHGYSEIGFTGEYPIAEITFDKESGKRQPVSIRQEVFSPFIPMDTKHSSLPMTVLRYTVENTSRTPVDVELGGWLENPVLAFHRDSRIADAKNLVVSYGDMEGFCMRSTPPLIDPNQAAPDVHVFEDFENGYSGWRIDGKAFGDTPAQGSHPTQNEVTGFEGEGLVNTFLGTDQVTGTAASENFSVDMPFIAMLIGGGGHSRKTCVNLLVDGKVVRTATGKNREQLEWHNWDVSDLIGKRAQIQIVDHEEGPWGHINVDQIVFSSEPVDNSKEYDPDWPQLGDVSLMRIDGPACAAMGFSSGDEVIGALSDGCVLTGRPKATRRPIQERSVGAITAEATLQPGESHTFTFVLSWFFPNRIQSDEDWAAMPGGLTGERGPVVGNMYANWFNNSLEVAQYYKDNQDRLESLTRLFRDTLYDTSLPYWFIHRLSMPLANLATSLVQWHKDGRFWAWEGTGCCPGNCGHVWNYAQAVARLFPEWERSVRRDQDFNPERGFDESTGLILFRGSGKIGEGWTGGWAADSQGGYILKAYREHLCSADSGFLKTHWRVIKKATEALIEQDGNDGDIDGFLEGKQHNTYDIDYYGANTLVGAVYHAALRAAAKMAKIMDDSDFSQRCAQLADKGERSTMQHIWREDWGYFVQDVDLAQHPRNQQGDGCLADQLFGQSLAHQLGLGHIYPESAVKRTMESIWKYNWAPDVALQNQAHPPERWYCKPGEAGLFMCTWPKSQHLGPTSVRYRNEVWTGTEYQVAAHMFYEGMTTEPLAIVRAIHERYDGVKHNPWNEVECGDHYARALASWGCLLGVSGFEYNGPAGHIGFSPKLNPESFKCFFSGAEGWGSYSQQIDSKALAATIRLEWGELRLRSISLHLPRGAVADAVTVNGKARAGVLRAGKDKERTTIQLDDSLLLKQGESARIRVSLG